ncbi:MAG: hypothetical protein NXI17_23915 [Alphaproteobacteria bacterium]|nr:hypothetical protein [Alphaproteobacteria bacterium]
MANTAPEGYSLIDGIKIPDHQAIVAPHAPISDGQSHETALMVLRLETREGKTLSDLQHAVLNEKSSFTVTKNPAY